MIFSANANRHTVTYDMPGFREMHKLQDEELDSGPQDKQEDSGRRHSNRSIGEDIVAGLSDRLSDGAAILEKLGESQVDRSDNESIGRETT